MAQNLPFPFWACILIGVGLLGLGWVFTKFRTKISTILNFQPNYSDPASDIFKSTFFVGAMGVLWFAAGTYILVFSLIQKFKSP